MNLEELTVKLGFHAETHGLEAVEHHLEGIHEKLEFLAAGELLKGVYELAERFAGFGEGLEGAAASAGITTDALQQLSYAAAQNGVTQDSLSISLAHLSRMLQQAKDGSQEALAQFAKAGIDEAQLRSFHSSTDALKALSDAFAASNDPIQKQALAMQLLGRGSVTMVKFLNRGSGAIAEMEGKAKSVGAVLGEDSVKQLAEFEAQMVSFGQSCKVLAATLASYVAPAIRVVVEKVQDFLVAHHQFVQTTLRHWAENFAFALGYVAGLISEATLKLIEFARAHPLLASRIAQVVGAAMGLSIFATIGLKIFSVVKTLMGGVSSLGTVFAAARAIGMGSFKSIFLAARLARGGVVVLLRAMGLLVANAFPAVATALGGLQASIAALPLGWVIAGVAGVVLGVQSIWAMLNGKSFRDTWLGELVAQILDLPEKLKGLYHWLTKGSYDAKPIAQHGWPSWMPGLGGEADQTEARAAPSHATSEQAASLDFVGKMMGYHLDLAHAAAGNANAMQHDARIASTAPSLPSISAAAAERPQLTTMNVDAPITVTVPPGMPPDRAAKAVTDGVQQHLDRVHSDAMRSLTTAQVH